jgi:hypothetical protein
MLFPYFSSANFESDFYSENRFAHIDAGEPAKDAAEYAGEDGYEGKLNKKEKQNKTMEFLSDKLQNEDLDKKSLQALTEKVLDHWKSGSNDIEGLGDKMYRALDQLDDEGSKELEQHIRALTPEMVKQLFVVKAEVISLDAYEAVIKAKAARESGDNESNEDVRKEVDGHVYRIQKIDARIRELNRREYARKMKGLTFDPDERVNLETERKDRMRKIHNLKGSLSGIDFKKQFAFAPKAVSRYEKKVPQEGDVRSMTIEGQIVRERFNGEKWEFEGTGFSPEAKRRFSIARELREDDKKKQEAKDAKWASAMKDLHDPNATERRKRQATAKAMDINIPSDSAKERFETRQQIDGIEDMKEPRTEWDSATNSYKTRTVDGGNKRIDSKKREQNEIKGNETPYLIESLKNDFDDLENSKSSYVKESYEQVINRLDRNLKTQSEEEQYYNLATARTRLENLRRNKAMFENNESIKGDVLFEKFYKVKGFVGDHSITINLPKDEARGEKSRKIIIKDPRKWGDGMYSARGSAEYAKEAGIHVRVEQLSEASDGIPRGIWIEFTKPGVFYIKGEKIEVNDTNKKEPKEDSISDKTEKQTLEAEEKDEPMEPKPSEKELTSEQTLIVDIAENTDFNYSIEDGEYRLQLNLCDSKIHGEELAKQIRDKFNTSLVYLVIEQQGQKFSQIYVTVNGETHNIDDNFSEYVDKDLSKKLATEIETKTIDALKKVIKEKEAEKTKEPEKMELSEAQTKLKKEQIKKKSDVVPTPPEKTDIESLDETIKEIIESLGTEEEFVNLPSKERQSLLEEAYSFYYRETQSRLKSNFSKEIELLDYQLFKIIIQKQNSHEKLLREKSEKKEYLPLTDVIGENGKLITEAASRIGTEAEIKIIDKESATFTITCENGLVEYHGVINTKNIPKKYSVYGDSFITISGIRFVDAHNSSKYLQDMRNVMSVAALENAINIDYLRDDYKGEKGKKILEGIEESLAIIKKSQAELNEKLKDTVESLKSAFADVPEVTKISTNEGEITIEIEGESLIKFTAIYQNHTISDSNGNKISADVDFTIQHEGMERKLIIKKENLPNRFNEIAFGRIGSVIGFNDLDKFDDIFMVEDDQLNLTKAEEVKKKFHEIKIPFPEWADKKIERVKNQD